MIEDKSLAFSQLVRNNIEKEIDQSPMRRNRRNSLAAKISFLKSKTQRKTETENLKTLQKLIQLSDQKQTNLRRKSENNIAEILNSAESFLLKSLKNNIMSQINQYEDHPFLQYSQNSSNHSKQRISNLDKLKFDYKDYVRNYEGMFIAQFQYNYCYLMHHFKDR